MSDNKRMIDFKIKLRNTILNIYKTKGYTNAVNSVNHLIKQSNKKTKEFDEKGLAMNLRGECCELLLELQILEFARNNNLPWILSKGLTMRRKDYKKKATTELDLTLFTPSRIVLFESKYRMGKIKLIEECTIVPNYGNVTDVYKQNLMHLDNLRYYLTDAIINLKAGKPFSIALYVDQIERVTDLREEKYKRLVPLVGTENIETYLKKIASMKQRVWDIQALKTIISKMDAESDSLFEEHVERMTKK